MRGTVRHYFFSFLPLMVLTGLVPLVVLAIGLLLSTRGPVGVLLGFVFGTLYAAGMAWFLAWTASRRSVLAHPQEAKGLYRWRYVDLAAPYQAVFDACDDTLRALPRAEPTLQDPSRGFLIAETRASLLSWGSEISLWVEALGETYTRVQVLSRPVIPSNIFDFGANERNVNRVVEVLRTRFALVREG
jgi:hypothetical protein